MTAPGGAPRPRADLASRVDEQRYAAQRISRAIRAARAGDDTAARRLLEEARDRLTHLLEEGQPKMSVPSGTAAAPGGADGAAQRLDRR